MDLINFSLIMKLRLLLHILCHANKQIMMFRSYVATMHFGQRQQFTQLELLNIYVTIFRWVISRHSEIFGCLINYKLSPDWLSRGGNLWAQSKTYDKLRS